MSTVFHDLSQESRNIVVGGLKSCSSRNGVDELFNKYDIHESEVRIALLREAMGNPETFYSHKLPEDEMYQQEVSMLLTKAWEINELYAKGVLNNS